jgi:hypothetical protein
LTVFGPGRQNPARETRSWDRWYRFQQQFRELYFLLSPFYFLLSSPLGCGARQGTPHFRMSTHEISFNSQSNLARQVRAFKIQHPRAKYDEAPVKRAETVAGKMDNERKRTSERGTLVIEYTES